MQSSYRTSTTYANSTDLAWRIQFGYGSGGSGPKSYSNYVRAVRKTIPVILVAPVSLNFGYVPVGSTKDLFLTVKNTGSGTLTGIATTTVPFIIVSGGSYSLYMKMENNPLLLKTFTVNNQLDRDFYIRGHHEGADNSLCKS